MKQAYQHIEPGTEHYEFIKGQLQNLIDRWNSVHPKSQVDPNIIAKEFKSVIRYNHNITVDDIRPAIDYGMMGRFGENFILDSQTIYRWFTGWLKQKVNERIKGAEAYKVSSEPEPSEEQKQANRQEIRTELIEVFMKYYNFYLEHDEVDGNIKRYYVVFWSWFRSLGLVDISEEEESRMNEVEAKHLRDLRSKLSTPELSESKYKKFIEIFKNLEGLGIEDQLKSIVI